MRALAYTRTHKRTHARKHMYARTHAYTRTILHSYGCMHARINTHILYKCTFSMTPLIHGYVLARDESIIWSIKNKMEIGPDAIV